MRARLFDIHAHPDLPKKWGARPPGDLRRYYEPVVAALAETGAAYEISTAGRRKPCAECYPAPGFARLACAVGVPVVLSSDAHRPAEVGRDFDHAAALAREAGYTSVLRFRGREPAPEPLP